ncbi:STY0301 family protein [Chitinimonas sp. BJB300]|uniref:STY0301 family protein n=1 Tax=Chitinimonas sp. BJB300 TaxID=1559339 RepID=UPI000C0DCF84|nr:STY0301 family protein [Chitinimonas sp. BJB300]PHV12424.1 hypothetical protein CSQ89_05945 [Chitinimonas sp. BJB300]TSJ89024.1 hypothetical protein FG002_009065 [Chitinimonas sp. BJB300]
MHKLVKFLTVIVTISQVAAFEFECPSSLRVKQQIDKPPQGWTSWSRDPMGHTGDPAVQEVVAQIPVSQLELYAGVPSESNADDLPPIGGYGDGDRAKNRYAWDLRKEASKQFYAACRYGHSDIRLVRVLPEGVKKCTAMYSGNGPVLSLRCDIANKK